MIYCRPDTTRDIYFNNLVFIFLKQYFLHIALHLALVFRQLDTSN